MFKLAYQLHCKHWGFFCFQSKWVNWKRREYAGGCSFSSVTMAWCGPYLCCVGLVLAAEYCFSVILRRLRFDLRLFCGQSAGFFCTRSAKQIDLFFRWQWRMIPLPAVLINVIFPYMHFSFFSEFTNLEHLQGKLFCVPVKSKRDYVLSLTLGFFLFDCNFVGINDAVLAFHYFIYVRLHWILPHTTLIHLEGFVWSCLQIKKKKKVWEVGGRSNGLAG